MAADEFEFEFDPEVSFITLTLPDLSDIIALRSKGLAAENELRRIAEQLNHLESLHKKIYRLRRVKLIRASFYKDGPVPFSFYNISEEFSHLYRQSFTDTGPVLSWDIPNFLTEIHNCIGRLNELYNDVYELRSKIDHYEYEGMLGLFYPDVAPAMEVLVSEKHSSLLRADIFRNILNFHDVIVSGIFELNARLIEIEISINSTEFAVSKWNTDHRAFETYIIRHLENKIPDEHRQEKFVQILAMPAAPVENTDLFNFHKKLHLAFVDFSKTHARIKKMFSTAHGSYQTQQIDIVAKTRQRREMEFYMKNIRMFRKFIFDLPVIVDDSVGLTESVRANVIKFVPTQAIVTNEGIGFPYKTSQTQLIAALDAKYNEYLPLLPQVMSNAFLPQVELICSQLSNVCNDYYRTFVWELLEYRSKFLTISKMETYRYLEAYFGQAFYALAYYDFFVAYNAELVRNFSAVEVFNGTRQHSTDITLPLTREKRTYRLQMYTYKDGNGKKVTGLGLYADNTFRAILTTAEGEDVVRLHMDPKTFELPMVVDLPAQIQQLFYRYDPIFGSTAHL